jgi:glycosyltransferase involved in cell wall biosynthesis
VLNSKAIPLLRDKYGISVDNISSIPHGTPNFDQSRREQIRRDFNISDQTVLSTFGLISPGKGLEHAIEAVAANASKHSNLHYYILGATHPSIVKQCGEAYREKLIALTQSLNVADRVHFVNRYLEIEELKDWLLATDIYVTPYINSNQIVSGTLSYAVAAGKPVLSTPYIHAVELLDGKAGLLTPFNNSEAMAQNLNLMLTDTALMERMRRKAREYASQSSWSEVGNRYLEQYYQAIKSKEPVVVKPKSQEWIPTANAQAY